MNDEDQALDFRLLNIAQQQGAAEHLPCQRILPSGARCHHLPVRSKNHRRRTTLLTCSNPQCGHFVERDSDAIANRAWNQINRIS